MEATQQLVSLANTLKCFKCGKLYDMAQLQTFATCCNQPLITTYDYNLKTPLYLRDREDTIWRYFELLPVFDAKNIVSLGEGWTRIHKFAALSEKLGVSITLKDESTNPTGSFKARGISVAVSKAKELGVSHCIIPTAGNAGGALSAYCAKAGMKATVIIPRYTPAILQKECTMFGAELILVDGMIDACGSLAAGIVKETGAFDMSTLKEPYRLEGKKTIGYEIAEQCNWQLPDVIIYPTGGGTGLIGMWKAFHEMKQLGWLNCKLPKMVVVQTDNCSPMVQLFEKGEITANNNNVASHTFGLAVPKPFAKDMIMQVLSQSEGTAISVSEGEIEDAAADIARSEGILLSPEGSTTYLALKKLIKTGWIKQESTVLLFNTGSWYKYQ